MLTNVKSFILQNFLIILVSIILAAYYLEISFKFRESFGFIQDTSQDSKDEVQKEATAKNTLNSLDSINFEGEELFTEQQLSKYKGDNADNKIYISILGSVYDVTKGAKYYGKDGTYNVFAGRDASVSFITGEFEDVTSDSDHVLKLKPSDILALYNWKKTYDTKYIYKGKLVGRFYDEHGTKTNYHLQVEKMLQDAIEEEERAANFENEFPSCNIEWKPETGTKVWCTTTSGGIKRDWIGMPRKYFEPGQTSYRCVCVHDGKLNLPQFEIYDKCDPKSDTCFYSVEN